jgi:hypothetical protein
MKLQNTDNIERSRIIATAEALGDLARASHTFTGKAVLLTGDTEVLATPNGRECLLCSFRLLLRMVEHLTVWVPAESLRKAILAEANRIAYRTNPTVVVVSGAKPEGFDAILCVGTVGQPDLPWTVINSNGWLARVSSLGQSIRSDCSQTNPVGALGAACLGVAEIFKRLIALRPERGELNAGISFSFYDYRESEDPGPELPGKISVDAVLFGVGAIGNGIVHLLSVLPVVGRLVAVDRQKFQVENWGTCLEIGAGDFGVAKAEWAAGFLPPRLTTNWHQCSVEEYVEKCGNAWPFPQLVLNGLDNIAARRAAQGLWPDQIIDGAIGPTLCEVTLHPWSKDLSCLRCDFKEPTVDALEVQVRSTGLKAVRIAEPSALVEASDIEGAPAERREWLQSRRGKTICSVVSEGVLAALSAERQTQGFEPSAPFVACLSACMVVGEMVRYCAGWRPMLETGFQFDTLVGPRNGLFKTHGRKADCECVNRRKNIESVRALRFPKDDGIRSIQA